MRRILPLTLCVALPLLAARAEEPAAEWQNNWPQWRGPEATGVAPKADPPVKWDEKTNIK